MELVYKKRLFLALSKFLLFLLTFFAMTFEVGCTSAGQNTAAGNQSRTQTSVDSSGFGFGDLSTATVNDSTSLPTLDQVFTVAQQETFEPTYGTGSGSTSSSSGNFIPANCIPVAFVTQYLGGNVNLAQLPLSTDGTYACLEPSFFSGGLDQQLGFVFTKLLLTVQFMGRCLAYVLDDNNLIKYLAQAPAAMTDTGLRGLMHCAHAAFVTVHSSLAEASQYRFTGQGLESAYADMIDAINTAAD